MENLRSPESISSREIQLCTGISLSELIQSCSEGGTEQPRTLQTNISEEARQLGYVYGCESHVGTKEKGNTINEDGAFSVELPVQDGKEQILCYGVADGVSQSTWSDVGSRLAMESFLSATQSLKESFAQLDLETIDDASYSQFCAEFTRHIIEKWNELIHASKILIEMKDGVEQKYTPKGWQKDTYNRAYNRGDQEFFQTTLSGVVMGRTGAILFHWSDGPSRVVRTGQKHQSISIEPKAADLKLTEYLDFKNGRVVIRGKEFDSKSFMIRVARKGAESLQVIVGTDGIGNEIPDKDTSNLLDSSSCQEYISVMNKEYPDTDPSGGAADNRSIASGIRNFAMPKKSSGTISLNHKSLPSQSSGKRSLRKGAN